MRWSLASAFMVSRVLTAAPSSLDQTVDEMFDTLLVNGSYHRTLRFWDYQQGSWQEEQQTKQPLQSGDRVIALVNNLGATPLSERTASITA